MAKALSLIAIIGTGLLPYSAGAHHSYSEYDDTKSVEVEGTLVDVAWKNPHARIVVESVDAAGLRVDQGARIGAPGDFLALPLNVALVFGLNFDLFGHRRLDGVRPGDFGEVDFRSAEHVVSTDPFLKASAHIR